MPSGRAVLQGDACAMRVLRKLAQLEIVSPEMKSMQKDAKLALFELTIHKSGGSTPRSTTPPPLSSTLLPAPGRAAIDSTTSMAPSPQSAARSTFASPASGGAAAVAGALPVNSKAVAERHVMISYSWSQQKVVVRLVKAFKALGLNVWFDVDNMKGCTIDAMAEAVENSTVVCICMSTEYKESANCRFEANYVTLRKIPYICLQMEEGYEPRGWLGIMLGMNLWYAFYAETLQSDEAFDVKVSAVLKAIACHHHPAAALVAESGGGGDDGTSGAGSGRESPAGGDLTTLTSPPRPALASSANTTPLGQVSAPPDNRVLPSFSWPADLDVLEADSRTKDAIDEMWHSLKAELTKLLELRDCGLIGDASYKDAVDRQLSVHSARKEVQVKAMQFHRMHTDGVVTKDHLQTAIGALLLN